MRSEAVIAYLESQIPNYVFTKDDFSVQITDDGDGPKYDLVWNLAVPKPTLAQLRSYTPAVLRAIEVKYEAIEAQDVSSMKNLKRIIKNLIARVEALEALNSQ